MSAPRLSLQIAEARERADLSGWADRDRIAYAGLCLTAGRLEAAAAALGADLPSTFERWPEARADLPRFDPGRRCVKCGAGDAGAEYRPDRLDRSCRRCGYRWTELPLDAAEVEPCERARS